MQNNTHISNDVTHQTKFIDPRSGVVLREGTTPISTIGAFKEKGSNVPVPKEETRIDKLEGDMAEIKDMLKELLNK